MSQLVKHIMAKDTGDRKILDNFTPLYRDMVSIEQSISTEPVTIARVYDIRAVFDARVYIPVYEACNTHNDVIGAAVKRTKEQIIQAVFGEFREDFMRLEHALYNRDFEQSRILLNEFRNKMFSEE